MNTERGTPRYTVRFSPAAGRDFRKLAPSVKAQLQPDIDALALEPRPAGVTKLKGEENLYRVRSGVYRILYSIEDDVLRVLVVKVGHRSDVYR